MHEAKAYKLILTRSMLSLVGGQTGELTVGNRLKGKGVEFYGEHGPIVRFYGEVTKAWKSTRKRHEKSSLASLLHRIERSLLEDSPLSQSQLREDLARRIKNG